MTDSHAFYRALAKSIIGLCMTEVIGRQGPWRNLEGVELGTLARKCFDCRVAS